MGATRTVHYTQNMAYPKCITWLTDILLNAPIDESTHATRLFTILPTRVATSREFWTLIALYINVVKSVALMHFDCFLFLLVGLNIIQTYCDALNITETWCFANYSAHSALRGCLRTTQNYFSYFLVYVSFLIIDLKKAYIFSFTLTFVIFVQNRSIFFPNVLRSCLFPYCMILSSREYLSQRQVKSSMTKPLVI